MYEYLKGLSVTLCLLGDRVGENTTSEELNNLSLFFLKTSKLFLANQKDIKSLEDLRKETIYLVSFLELLKFTKRISSSNAEFIITSVTEFLKVLSTTIEHEKSLVPNLLALSDLDTSMVRNFAKHSEQEKYIQGDLKKNYFTNFGKIFNENPDEIILQKHLEEKLASTAQSISEQVHEVESKPLHVPTIFNKKHEVETKSDQPNPTHKKTDETGSSSKLVYTYFGDNEQKVIEERREKIMSVLKRGGGNIKEILANFPGINEKMLQRDLSELMRDRRVVMMGKKRWAKYYVK